MVVQLLSPRTRVFVYGSLESLASSVRCLRLLGQIILVATFTTGGRSALAQTRATTDAGVIEGKLNSDGQVAAFLGVPYAAPPVGPLRWKKPQEVAHWKGLRDAKEFGPHCMQPPIFKDMRFRDWGQSEDCLTLNIWTPQAKTDNNLPVMVWIHGGGFNGGGSSEPRQDGEKLARRGVVVVSVNYRLGIFGFMVHHQLSAESPKGSAGNYGLMDQAAALRWVQRNAAAFGGNPARVTLFGESAGSISVSAHIASTWSSGTFVRAIGESGGAFAVTGLTFPTRATSERKDEAFVAAVWGAQTVADLRKLPAEELLRATSTRKDSPLFEPDIDGDFLALPVPRIYTEGVPNPVPVLAGWNRDEDRQADPALRTAAGLHREAEARFGQRADEFERLYGGAASDEDASRAADELATDQFMGYCTWRWLEASVAQGVPVYRYSFDLPSPRDAFHAPGRAFHSDEIECVFGTLDSRSGATWRPEDYLLSSQIQTYWVNFASTGNPNGPERPPWPKYAASDWQVMHLDGSGGQTISHSAPDFHRNRYLFLAQVWGNTPLAVAAN